MVVNKNNVPNYVGEGSEIGEYVILIPVETLNPVEKEGLKVESLKNTARMARENEMFAYAYNYMKDKYGSAAA